MAYDPRLQIDMTPDGRFSTPRRAPITNRIIVGAVLLAVVAVGLAFAALALWVAFALIPVAIVAVLVAYAMIRFKLWQARRRGASFGREGGPLTRRP